MDEKAEFKRRQRIKKIKELKDIVGALKVNNEFPQDREARREYIERRCYNPILVLGGEFLAMTSVAIESSAAKAYGFFTSENVWYGWAPTVLLAATGLYLTWVGTQRLFQDRAVRDLGQKIKESTKDGRIQKYDGSKGLGLEGTNFNC